MRRLLAPAFVISFAIAAPLPAQAEHPRAPAADAKTPVLVRFDWPAPASVIVTDTTTKKGRTAKMRYRLVISRRDDGGLRVRYRDFEFLEIAGRKVDTPAMREALAPALAMASAIPDYVVAADGAFVEADGLDEMARRVVERLSASEGGAAADRAAAMFARPKTRQLLTSAVAKYWDAWAGTWIGWDVPEGDNRMVDSKDPVLGVAVPARRRLSNFGPAPGHAGCIRLTKAMAASGPEVKRALASILQGVAGETADIDAEIAEAAMRSEVTVITDPKTLCPRVVETEQVMRVRRTGDDEAIEQVESHRYEFAWPK